MEPIQVAERLLAVVAATASRQVVAATSIAFLRCLCNCDDVTKPVLAEQEDIFVVARTHFGEDVGIARVCSAAKDRGAPQLAKQISQHNRSRRTRAHPVRSSGSLASQLAAVLQGNPAPKVTEEENVEADPTAEVQVDIEAPQANNSEQARHQVKSEAQKAKDAAKTNQQQVKLDTQTPSVLVTNMPPSWADDDLKTHFMTCGRIVSAKVHVGPVS